MVLRPYQQDIIDRLILLMRQGAKNILTCAPTGSGKTIIMAHICNGSYIKSKPCWIIHHRKELIDQTSSVLLNLKIPHGIIASGYVPNYAEPIQICSINTLKNRLDKLHTPATIIWDEAHHIVARSWHKVRTWANTSYHLGFTATACRLDGTGLQGYFDSLVQGPTIKWLIANGYLADYRMFSPPSPNMKGVHRRMGDWVNKELEVLMSSSKIVGDAIEHYRQICPNAQALVYCVNINHSKRIAEEFIKNHIRAAHVDGNTPKQTRQNCIQRFRNGELKIITNCDLFGEGLDVPAIECTMLLRPTQSVGLYLQQVGRALRPKQDGRLAIVLDHAGNIRHGLPCEEREWTLEGKAKSNPGSDFNVKICPICFAANRSGGSVCANCNNPYPVEERQITESRDQLIEVDKEQVAKQNRMLQGQAKTYQDLVAEGVRRGMKNPGWWAHKVLEGRKRKHGISNNSNVSHVQTWRRPGVSRRLHVRATTHDQG